MKLDDKRHLHLLWLLVPFIGIIPYFAMMRINDYKLHPIYLVVFMWAITSYMPITSLYILTMR